MSPVESSWAKHLTKVEIRENAINTDQSQLRQWLKLLVTVQRRHLWVVTLSQKYPVNFAASQSI
jgi:hypothetical protein